MKRSRSSGRDARGAAVTAKLIADQGRALQGYEHSAKRAAQLAAEIERLNRVVFRAADAIALDDEPSRYAVVVERSRQSRRR